MELSGPTTPAGKYPAGTPSLIKIVSQNQAYGFDLKQTDLTDIPGASTSSALTSQPEAAGTATERSCSFSISIPPSPVNTQLQSGKRALFKDLSDLLFGNDATKSAVTPMSSVASSQTQKISYSQPIPRSKGVLPLGNPEIESVKDDTFDSFRTRSGYLERQIPSLLGGRSRETPHGPDSLLKNEVETLNVDRYFDALEGPELDTLKPSEQMLLPEDKQWPFLLRYPISSFSICLGVSSQAIMWKALATSASTKFLKVSLHVNLALWCISLALVAFVSCIYILKMIFYFEAVRREYLHPVRINFFFSPWIALLFLALGAPPSFSQKLHGALWYILMTPIFCLELKIYGQWMSGGQRRLSKVANPSNHLSIVGNFVGALLGASMGLKEGPIFFFAVGLAHYTVLFVTLYQRLPTNETLPQELHPVFFLFVAAPSVASMAWASIQGSFDIGSRIAYFVALFLYCSLAVRINFFRGFRFSLAWWAYTFPMTGAATATIKYSTVVMSTVTKCITVALCGIATLTVTALLVTTVFHAFVLRDLFPNDMAIAISGKRPKSTRRWHIIRSGSSAAKPVEHYLKFANPDQEDLEAPSTEPPTSTTRSPQVTTPNDVRCT